MCMGCGRFFNAVRDTVSDKILMTYKAGESRPAPTLLEQLAASAKKGDSPMSGANRIAGAGRLTPAKTLRFTFDGRIYTGLEGDTLASALLANGVHLMGSLFQVSPSTRSGWRGSGRAERTDGHRTRQGRASSPMSGQLFRKCSTA